MNIVLDGICLIILAVCAVGAWVKGFVRTVLEMLSTLIALVAAWLLSGKLAAWFAESFITPAIVGSVKQSMEGEGGGLLGSLIDGLGFSELVSGYESQLNGVSGMLGDMAAQQVAASFSLTLSRFILFALLFLLTMVVLNLVISVVDALAKLPVLRSLNKLLGLVVGLLKGALLTFVFCFGLALFVSLSGGGENVPISERVIQKTAIVRVFYNSGPIQNFLTPSG